MVDEITAAVDDVVVFAAVVVVDGAAVDDDAVKVVLMWYQPHAITHHRATCKVVQTVWFIK